MFLLVAVFLFSFPILLVIFGLWEFLVVSPRMDREWAERSKHYRELDRLEDEIDRLRHENNRRQGNVTYVDSKHVHLKGDGTETRYTEDRKEWLNG